jgi:hypothetical protein
MEEGRSSLEELGYRATIDTYGGVAH